MKIQTNTAANSALGYARVNAQNTERSIQRLSSGFRINSAKDDAAGLAIANNLRSDGRALQQASRNAAQGLSMLQTADGAAQTISTILDRAKELAAQAASDNIGSERTKLHDEFAALRSEIGRILDTTKYQGTNVLTGLSTTVTATAAGAASAANGVAAVSVSQTAVAQVYTLTVAENASAAAATITLAGADGSSQTIQLDAEGEQTLDFSALGIKLRMNSNFDANGAGGLDTGTITVASTGTAKTLLVGASRDYAANDTISMDVGTLETVRTALALENLSSLSAAQTALVSIDTAIGNNNTFLGKVGAVMNRVEFAKSNTETMLQNTQAAESTIRDADMAYEMTQFTKNNILQQAAQSMLSQANQGTQGILQLLRG